MPQIADITQKIYKYTSADTAILIINDGRLLMRSPELFNDPFDTNLTRDKDDVEKVRQIVSEYIGANELLKLTKDPTIASAIKNNPQFINAKKEYFDLLKTLKVTHRFDSEFKFSELYKLFNLDRSTFKDKVDESAKKMEDRITKEMKETRSNTIATCFSKVCDSILMWSHYGDSHKGVCIEYERPDYVNFQDVIYSFDRPKVKMADLVSFVTAEMILKQNPFPQPDPQLVEKVLKPYLTKAKEWEYEKEVRCLVKVDSKSEYVINENGKFYYKMPKPLKIFIGCQASKEDTNKIVKLAKKHGIKYYFYKVDKNTYSLKIK